MAEWSQGNGDAARSAVRQVNPLLPGPLGKHGRKPRIIPQRIKIRIRHEPVDIPHPELNRLLEVIEGPSAIAQVRVKAANVVEHQRIRGVGVHRTARPLFGLRLLTQQGKETRAQIERPRFTWIDRQGPLRSDDTSLRRRMSFIRTAKTAITRLRENERLIIVNAQLCSAL